MRVEMKEDERWDEIKDEMKVQMRNEKGAIL